MNGFKKGEWLIANRSPSYFIKFELSYNQSDMTITGSFAVGFNQRFTSYFSFWALATFPSNRETV